MLSKAASPPAIFHRTRFCREDTTHTGRMMDGPTLLETFSSGGIVEGRWNGRV